MTACIKATECVRRHLPPICYSRVSCRMLSSACCLSVRPTMALPAIYTGTILNRSMLDLLPIRLPTQYYSHSVMRVSLKHHHSTVLRTRTPRPVLLQNMNAALNPFGTSLYEPFTPTDSSRKIMDRCRNTHTDSLNASVRHMHSWTWQDAAVTSTPPTQRGSCAFQESPIDNNRHP